MPSHFFARDTAPNVFYFPVTKHLRNPIVPSPSQLMTRKRRSLPCVMEQKPLSLAASIISAWLGNIHSALAIRGGPAEVATEHPYHLRTTLCADKCESNCVMFDTPTDECFSAHQLFPNDDSESWSEFDIFDSVSNDPTFFQRTIYASIDGSCGGLATDVFTIPLDECVGPFGPPRPWGNFSIVINSASKNGTNDAHNTGFVQQRVRERTRR